MSLRFKNTSCVVVGTFNTYIPHPQWLAKHTIIPEGIEVIIETNFTRPGMRYRIEKLKSTWIVAPDRLSVESDDSELDCGQPVAGMLTVLHETPLHAIGNNVCYEGERSELPNLSEAIAAFPSVAIPAADGVISQRMFHIAVKHSEELTTNIQVVLRGENVELLCNAHRELKGDDFNKNAVAAAKGFMADRLQSKQLARQLFGPAID